MAREVARDAVFGRLDCNDNTPILQPQQNKTRAQPGLPSEWSAGGVAQGHPSVTDSPLRCPSRASNASSMSDLNSANQTLGTLITSNYNNDFFYDDEFSVQFDANLGEGEGTVGEVPMSGDVDINAILQQLPEADHAYPAEGTSASQSESGLYPGDMSTSEGLDTSQEQSLSEHDCASSSELSELRNEPLFSPPPSQEEQTLSTDSLGKDASLNNSLLNEEEFSYDWSANKEQYMISFGGSVHKVSDTESMTSSGTCAAIQGSLTSWAKHSKEDSPNKYMWGSDTSSVLSLGQRSGATSPVPPKSPEKPPRRPVTAWHTVQEQLEECEHVPEKPLTTWRSLKETGSPKVEAGGVRSKSLPELARKQQSPAPEEKSTEDGEFMEDSVESGKSEEECVERPNSENLYELFQRLRSCSDEEDHGSLSPNAMNQLMGTWSMSPAGSDHSLTSVGITKADTGSHLSSWATLQHLASDGEVAKAPSLGTIKEPTTKEIANPKTFADALVGSGVITGSQIWGPPKKPPRVTSSAVQTSLIEDTLEMMEKAQQTSIAAFDKELAKRARHWLSILEIPPKVILKYMARQQQEQPPFNRDKISNAVFYSNSRMPDLSFLEEHGMSHSEALRTIMGKEYNQKASMRDTSPGSKRRSRSYDSSSGYSSGCSGIDPGSFNESQSRKFMDMPSYPSPKAQDVLSESEYEQLVSLRQRCGYSGKEPGRARSSPDRNLPLQKRVGDACKQCKKKSNIMSMSVPVYKGQVFARTPRDADFFDIFEPRDWYKMTMSANVPRLMQRLQSPTPMAACHKTCIQNKPLKSCLVKKRQRQKSLFRNSSFSNHHDLTVMKYSQEGQTRYQLLAPAEGRECVHGLSSKSVSARPVEAPKPQQAKPASIAEAPLEQPCCHHKVGCPQAPLPNSPDLIPVMPCPCQAPPAPQPTTEDTVPPALSHHHPRAKKSVSFSEEISYHSPKPSPHTSPQKQCHASADVAPPVRPRSASLDSSRRLPVPGQPDWHKGRAKTTEDMDLESSGEEPPRDFTVSPPSVSPPQSFIASTTATESTPKRELMLAVVRGAEVILAYFTQARDQQHKVILGCTSRSPEIGQLILQHLCPAIHAVLQDGLRPYTRSLFGQMRNCAWALVEESCHQGPATRALHTLIQDLTNLAFLDTNWLRFNAFVFGLLNHRALDFWLTYLQHQDRLLLKHYEADSLMSMSTNRCRHLFMAMTTALQSLAQLPLRLEYTFEYRQQQQRHADFLLDKHLSAATETQLEGQLFLKQMEHNVQAVNGGQMQQSAPGQLQPSLDPFPGPYLPVKPMAQSEFSCLQKPQIHSPPDAPPPSYQEAVGDVWEPPSTRQTKDLLSAGGRLVGRLQEQTALISLDAINSTLPVNSLLPKPSSKPLTPTPVPVLHGINDSNSSQTSITVDLVSSVPSKPEGEQEMLLQVTTTVSAAPVCQLPSPKAVAVVKNNEILAPEQYESKESSPVECGLLSKVSQQLQPSIPDDKVYKRGVTEYEFDLEADGRGLTNLTKASIKNIPCQTGKPGQVESTESWTQDSGIDELRSQELAGRELPVLRAMPMRRDPSKRWSEGEATALLSDSGCGKVEVGMNQVKKRWSTFGPKIIQFFDKLLLDENQKPCSDSATVIQQEKDNVKNEEQERSQSKEEVTSPQTPETPTKLPMSPTKSKLPIAKDIVKKAGLVSPTRQSSPRRKLPPTPEGVQPVDLVESTRSKQSSPSRSSTPVRRQSSLPVAKCSPTDVRSPASPCRESRIPTLNKKSVKAPAASPSTISPTMKSSQTQNKPVLGEAQDYTLPSGVVYKKEVVAPVSNCITVYPQQKQEEAVSNKASVPRAQHLSPARKSQHSSPSRPAQRASPTRRPAPSRPSNSQLTDSQTSTNSTSSVSSRRAAGAPRKQTVTVSERKNKEKVLRAPSRKQPEKNSKIPGMVGTTPKSKLPGKAT